MVKLVDKEDAFCAKRQKFKNFFGDDYAKLISTSDQIKIKTKCGPLINSELASVFLTTQSVQAYNSVSFCPIKLSSDNPAGIVLLYDPYSAMYYLFSCTKEYVWAGLGVPSKKAELYRYKYHKYASIVDLWEAYVEWKRCASLKQLFRFVVYSLWLEYKQGDYHQFKKECYCEITANSLIIIYDCIRLKIDICSWRSDLSTCEFEIWAKYLKWKRNYYLYLLTYYITKPVLCWQLAAKTKSVTKLSFSWSTKHIYYYVDQCNVTTIKRCSNKCMYAGIGVGRSVCSDHPAFPSAKTILTTDLILGCIESSSCRTNSQLCYNTSIISSNLSNLTTCTDSTTSTSCKCTDSTSCKCTDSTSTSCKCTDSTSTSCKCTDSTSTSCKCTDSTSTSCKCTDSTSTFSKCTDSTSTFSKCTDSTSTFSKCTDSTSTSSKCTDSTSTSCKCTDSTSSKCIDSTSSKCIDSTSCKCTDSI